MDAPTSQDNPLALTDLPRPPPSSPYFLPPMSGALVAESRRHTLHLYRSVMRHIRALDDLQQR